MRLPWVGRAAYDAVCAHRDWLASQLVVALDHNRRLDRAESKLPETPIPQRRTREPMPPDIREAIQAWDGETTRRNLEDSAWARYDRDGHWDNVRGQLMTTGGE